MSPNEQTPWDEVLNLTSSREGTSNAIKKYRNKGILAPTASKQKYISTSSQLLKLKTESNSVRDASLR
jgi:hypothetical protein